LYISTPIQEIKLLRNGEILLRTRSGTGLPRLLSIRPGIRFGGAVLMSIILLAGYEYHIRPPSEAYYIWGAVMATKSQPTNQLKFSAARILVGTSGGKKQDAGIAAAIATAESSGHYALVLSTTLHPRVTTV